LETLDALLGRGGCDAADVVFKGAEFDLAGSREEGLLGDVEMRIDLAGDLPCESVLNIEEARKLAGVLNWSGHAEVVDFEELGLDGDASVGDVVAADDDVVGVEGLGDADGCGASGAEVGWEAEMIQRVLTVVA